MYHCGSEESSVNWTHFGLCGSVLNERWGSQGGAEGEELCRLREMENYRRGRGWSRWISDVPLCLLASPWWRTGKPGVCSPWGCKESDTTEQLNKNKQTNRTLSKWDSYLPTKTGKWGAIFRCWVERSVHSFGCLEYFQADTLSGGNGSS